MGIFLEAAVFKWRRRRIQLRLFAAKSIKRKTRRNVQFLYSRIKMRTVHILLSSPSFNMVRSFRRRRKEAGFCVDNETARRRKV